MARSTSTPPAQAQGPTEVMDSGFLTQSWKPKPLRNSRTEQSPAWRSAAHTVMSHSISQNYSTKKRSSQATSAQTKSATREFQMPTSKTEQDYFWSNSKLCTTEVTINALNLTAETRPVNLSFKPDATLLAAKEELEQRFQKSKLMILWDIFKVFSTFRNIKTSLIWAKKVIQQ